MAEHDNRPFHVVAVVLSLIAGLIGRAVTYPHPAAWLFGAVAVLAVLIPAETAFLVLNSRRSKPPRVVRAPQPVAATDNYSLLGRALTAIETLLPGETELSGAFRRAVAVLEKRKGDGSVGVAQLRMTVSQLTMKLERSVEEENPDRLMLVQRMHLFREMLEEAIEAAEPG
ncbi:hypothetical protein DL991_19605 [Amycolatopsis sp. WAC 01375]|uniref:hypothetical protein n=1 Tax=unclassified Amycolatopsis TaxID=2618356 RepID=UPI000F781847|nr:MULTISPECIES: hypothetical protein [unclassified Amycolatopsis]RSM77725.1 hypothetical protein DL991_19605 [Amycolatopsis sp. WAC 01375]RSN28255.1 hypothetical protein DL990_26570 [Amycolatopsis sp. WAC 01416]